MTTFEKILSLLRRETLTVAELMARLQVTRNAIMVPLRQLEAKDMIIGQPRKEARVGKPSVEYTAAPGREDEASLAYPAFTALLVETLRESLDGDYLESVLRKVGRKMGTSLSVKPGVSFSSRLKMATDFADDLGAETLVDRADQDIHIRSFSCPLGSAVRRDSRVCQVIGAFFETVTGVPVQVCCERGEKLLCQFRLKNAESSPT